ncbi:maleylacetate reductase [Rhodococcus qingshengii]|uniref:maleylacetate reductase n=1 Tax=Rhodococcus qingshengii TaxID=334542 RepID=UPI0021BAD008|nr:maleylacetate reductase [Rhodococcus qingshengii]UXF67263.1 maleylacetate reductase [Rhodococcus qingshengii]
MTAFEHTTLAQRVLFGTGEAARHLAAEIERLGATAIMVLAGPQESDLAAGVIGDLDVAVRWDDVAPHVPVANARAATAAARDKAVDLLVSVGGGSTTGLAKAIALDTGIPIVAVPTTYAGSEATNVWGMTENSRKTTGVSDSVLPTTIVYDPALTASLPVELSVVSGLNALAHCVDSMWGPRSDPIDRALASEGIGVLSRALRAIKTDGGRTLAGREEALCGAYLSAVTFASAGSGLHHKICHVLGGAYDLPHAHTHAIVLPYVTAFLTPAAPEANSRIASALDSDDAVTGLNTLRTDIGAPTALRDHGFEERAIIEAAQLIMPAIPASTPRPVTVEDLHTLLHAAWAGDVPSKEMFPS